MISTNVRHLGVAVLSLCVLAAVQQACGGGGSSGGNGGGGGGGPQNTQLGVSTPTPGSEATPTSVTVIIPSGADVVEAAKRLPAGATVIVPPGTYAPIVFNPGDLPGSLILIADETGTLSNGLAAPVVITARGQSSGIEINGQSDITIDGFTVHGATDTAVLVKNSPRTVVADCTLSGTHGDGLQVVTSDDTLIFNNLIFDNAGAGIGLIGSNGVSVINNTVYKSMASGISVGDDADPSNDALLRNNIVNSNTPSGIVVAASASGYDGDYDLNNDGYDGTSEGAHDIAGTGPDTDPLFISPDMADFHLQQGVAGSVSPAIDAGDPNTDSDLVAILQQRTTQTDGTLDTGPVDLGYHYVSAQTLAMPTPVPVRTPTRGPAGRPTATHTGGVPVHTPTHRAGSTPTPTAGVHKPTPTPRH